MDQELFNIEELRQIAEEAQNPIYSEPNLIHLGSKKLSIIGVAQTNGLIMAYGNEWTGYKHIIDRHSLTSRNPYWNENNKMDNPTKFSLRLAPIEYLDVASQIFKPENKDSENNKNPQIFDVYTGTCKYRDGKEIEYRLITYKDSKVIHTLFINGNKKPFNKKKILNLRQGWVNASHDIKNCIQTLHFKYFDHNNIALFEVVLRYSEVKKSEKWYIQVNLEDGSPYLTTLIKESEVESELPVPFKMNRLDFSDVSWIEKVIKKIIEGRYEF
jgi:hypothetical protein